MKNIRVTRSPAVSFGAFTLIELLMVVAYLAILAVILLPVLQGVSRTGREFQCRNNLKQLGLAERLYVNENNGNMFPYQAGTWEAPVQPVYPALLNELVCPLTTVQPPPGEDSAGTYNLAWILYVNGSSGIYSNNGSYTFNGYLYGTVALLGSGDGDSSPFYKDANVQYPARTPAFSDGVWVDAWPSTNDIIPNPVNLQAPIGTVPGNVGDFGGEGEPGINGMWRLLISRHGPNRVNPPPFNLQWTSRNAPFLPGGINMVFYDDHVEDVSLNSLWSLYWHPGWVAAAPK